MAQDAKPTDRDALARIRYLVAEERALREAGGNPGEAAVRPPGQVEDYLS